MRLILSSISTLLAGIFLLLAAESAVAGDGKQKHTIAFHAEAMGAPDGKTRTFEHQVSGEMRNFEMTPTISHMEFAGFVPFRAEDGSFAAVFLLDNHGKLKLEQMTAAKKTTHVVATVDMKPVDVMVIDRDIKDGVIVLWKGLSPEHVQYLEKEMKVPVIRQPADRANIKEKP